MNRDSYEPRCTRKLAPLPGAQGGIELAPLQKERENLFGGIQLWTAGTEGPRAGGSTPTAVEVGSHRPGLAREARPPAKHKQTAAEQHRETTKTEKALDQDSARTKGRSASMYQFEPILDELTPVIRLTLSWELEL